MVWSRDKQEFQNFKITALEEFWELQKSDGRNHHLRHDAMQVGYINDIYTEIFCNLVLIDVIIKVLLLTVLR